MKTISKVEEIEIASASGKRKPQTRHDIMRLSPKLKKLKKPTSSSE